MASSMRSQCRRYDELYGLIEYYDAIFSREGLIKKECEFRTNKLSLILDLIRASIISDSKEASENLDNSLPSLIINAWRLQVPEKTLKHRRDELQFIHGSIEGIRNEIKRIKNFDNRSKEFRLSAMVLSYLPIVPSDLRLEEVARIYDLINQAGDNSLSLIDDRSIASKLGIISRETAIDSI
jgi:hypothetical protein